MTVSSTTRRAGPFLGNGATTAFPFTFKVFAASDLELTLTDDDGAETVLVLDTDYTITLNADQDNDPGGTVTYPVSGSPLAIGETLSGIGVLPFRQGTDITNLGRFLPQVHENVFDYITMLVQQLYELLSRTVRYPVSDGDGAPTLPTRAQRAGTLLAFNSVTGDPEAGPEVTAVVDAAAFLLSYLDEVAMSITFPFDMGLITDPLLYNNFDLGAL